MYALIEVQLYSWQRLQFGLPQYTNNMLHKLVLHSILLICCTCCHLVAQDQLTKIEEQDSLEAYFGNRDLLKAEQLVQYEEAPIKARVFYEKAILTLEKEQNWEGWIVANKGLIQTYLGKDNFEVGIAIAKASLDKIRNQPSIDKKYSFQLLHVISRLYVWAGRSFSALPYARKSLTILQRYEADNEPELVNSYTNLGIIHRRVGDADSALYYLQQATLLLAKPEVNDIKKRIANYEHIGFIYSVMANFDKAIIYTEEGLKLAVKAYGENDAALIMFYHNLAYFYAVLGEYEQSKNYYKKELYIFEKSKTKNVRYLSVVLPECLIGLGRQYLATEETAKARTYFDKTLALVDSISRSKLLKPSTLTAIGKSYVFDGDIEQAIHYLEQAENVYTQLHTLYSVDFYINEIGFDINTNLGAAYTEKGEFHLGRTYYHKALQFNFASGDTTLARHGADIYSRIAESFEKEHQLDSALYYNQVAITKTCNNIDTLNPLMLPRLKDLRNIPEVYFTLNQRVKLLSTLAAEQQEPAQQKQILEQALVVCDLGSEAHIDNLKKINVLRGAQNNSLIEYSIQNYRDGLSAAHTLHQMTASKATLKKGFAYTQKMKAQQLWLSLLKTEAAGFAKIPKSLLEAERDLQLNIQYYERKVIEARENKDSTTLNKYENNLLFESRKAYAELVQKMEEEHPEYFEAKYAFKAETEETLQSLLQERELLIEYVLSDSSLYIFTLAQNEPLQIKAVPLVKGINRQIIKLHEKLQNASWMRRSSRESLIRQSHQLYQQFLQPIEEQLNEKDRLIIIGDGMTNYIPFEALLPSATIKPFKDLDYLIKKHAISYHYSASLFAKSRRSQPFNTNTSIYAFAPVYEKNEPIASSPLLVTATANNLRAINSAGSFAHLPESEREAKAIIELFKQENTGTHSLALREDAHEAALKRQLEQDFQFVHIAGHSFADIENPKFSGIACFDNTKNEEEDGILYTGEIYALSAKADLVTLSSCESGFGKLHRTEGLLGLNRAFIYAGSPNVVFSLWKVYDKVSAQLMVDFYSHILAGENYSVALQQAKLKLLNNEATAAPHFWSPYLLIGR